MLKNVRLKTSRIDELMIFHIQMVQITSLQIPKPSVIWVVSH